MFNPITALKNLKAAYDLKNNVAALKKELSKGDKMDTQKAYSYAKGIWKGAKYLLVAIGGAASVYVSGLADLPDSLDSFLAAWPQIVVPIIIGLAKFAFNYFKQVKA